MLNFDDAPFSIYIFPCIFLQTKSIVVNHRLCLAAQSYECAMATKPTFPQRLHAVLNNPSLADIICWLPNGHSFVILRSDQLSDQVLPRYFSPDTSLKYSSFKRKLNRWGFHQIRKGADTGAFHHPLFKRDDPSLCLQMDCEKANTSTSRANARKLAPEPAVLAVTPKDNDLDSLGIIIQQSLSKFQSQQTVPPVDEDSLNSSKSREGKLKEDS